MKKTLKSMISLLMVCALALTCSAGSLSVACADEEPVKLTIAIMQDSAVENYDTNYMTNLIEKDCNVELEFIYFPSAVDDAKSKLSIMANSGDELPDIVMMSLTSQEAQQYGSAGIFIPLNAYLDDAAMTPNFNQLKAEYPEDIEAITNAITSADGNIYSLFDWAPEDWNFTPFRCWINQSWLKALNLEMPTTTQELKEVLTHFANDDPNGNGLKDEIALTGSPAGWGTYTPWYLMNAFEFYNGGLALAEDGKTVIAPFTTDKWKAGLEYMKELVDLGVLDPAMFTMDDTSFRALLDSDPNVVGCVCAGGWGYWSNSFSNPNFLDMTLIAPMEGPYGTDYAFYSPYSPGLCYFITADCKNPDVAMKVGDWFLSTEHSLTVRYGEQDVDWSIDPEICAQRVALYGGQGYECKIAILNNIWAETVSNKSWHQVGPRYTNLAYYRGKDALIVDGDSRDADYRALAGVYYADNHPKALPNLIYLDSELEAIAEPTANIGTFVSNQLAEFVTGNRPLSDWDSYLAELEGQGLNVWIETAQTAYDRMTASEAAK